MGAVYSSKPLDAGDDVSQNALAELLLHRDIEKFFHHEAALLDSWQYEQWLELLADDLVYWMPIRTDRAPGDEAKEFTQIGQCAFFDETKALLAQRVRKMRTGYCWAEEPRSRTRHMINGLRIIAERLDEVDTECNFLVYRSRLDEREDFWVGRRADTVRKINGRWLLAKRSLFLDHTLLHSQNMSVFF